MPRIASSAADDRGRATAIAGAAAVMRLLAGWSVRQPGGSAVHRARMSSAGPYVDADDDSNPANVARRRRKLGVLWRLRALMAPYLWRFVLAVSTLLAASAISLVYPQAARYAVDVGMRAGTVATLDRVVLGLIVVFLVHSALIWLRHYSMSWLGERVVADLRALVVDRVMTLPLGWFHERRTGELVGRLSSDVTVVEGVVGSELSLALRNGVQLLGGLVLLFVIDVRLTVMMLTVVPPIVLSAIYFGGKLRVMSRRVQDELAKVSGHVQEAVGAIQTVQSFVRERDEAQRYRQGVEGAFQRMMTLVRWRSSFWATTSAATYTGIAVVIWLGGRAMIRGDLTAGDLTSFFLYTFMVAGALGEMAGLWAGLQRAAGATERLFAVVDTVPELRDPEQPVPLPAGRGALAFANVSFAYPARPTQPVLRDVSFQVAPGEVVALVGPSGAGKSTILSLLFRFYDVNAGEILVEGVDVRQLRLGELRRALAMVAQEPVLFSGTLRANLAYGCPDATQEQIEAAARDANAHDFIVGFPDGYDTMIGERGTKLSGGQKQRVAIARALLANPRVLILDEATSNLDAESEALVQGALARLMKGRTTIVVAHRLSTVRDADRILVVDGAGIAEHGTHEALMARGGVYRRLIEHQIIAEDRAAS
jgi:ABC transporter fused permease/ATP-binding protein